MTELIYRGRRAVSIENDRLRITVLLEGGHIAEIFDKRSGINPLWTPPWPSIEPSAYDPEKHHEYGRGTDAKLLAGIMGHNVCLDLFGGPSEEEASAGMTAHGEGPVVPYRVSGTDREFTLSADLPLARVAFERSIALHGSAVRIREIVKNLSDFDRPIAWTQHVTLGPPFLETGVTQFRASARRSKVFEVQFGSADYLETGAEFDWPMAPRLSGGRADLQEFNGAPISSAFTTHLMDPQKEHAWFRAFSPSYQLAIAYIWRRADFRWMGIWEENHSRSHSPWNGQTLARGMEFGVSPIPESRAQMVARGRLFHTPTYGWLLAQGRLETEYWAIAQSTRSIPETIQWPG